MDGNSLTGKKGTVRYAGVSHLALHYWSIITGVFIRITTMLEWL
jgi:hypothetical protein